MPSRMLTTIALLSTLIAQTVAIPTISTLGNKFFDSTGKQFFIKGIAYQLIPHDPLIDTEQCTRDAIQMKDLGANAIRVYHVDPNGDHQGCMKAFADNGVYLFVDLDDFHTDINPTNITWDQFQYDSFAAIMDEFQQFDNVAGFFVGNEVIAKNDQSLAAPYIKAAARDMRAYRDSKKYRKIPIGYSAADIAELRPSLQNYLACGSDQSHAIEFFGLNAYEWCGKNDMATSGYNNLNEMAKNYNIPIFFSETGCNTVRPRDFADQSAILGPEMNEIWSGTIVYEWIEEANNYGIISYGPPLPATATGVNIEDGFTRKGQPTPVIPDYPNLKSQWATLSPTGVASSAYKPSLTPPACPSSTAGGWLVNGDVPLPTVGQAITTGVGGTAIVASTTSAPTSSATSVAASGSSTPSATPGSRASGGKEIAGMGIGLVTVMLGFMIWL